MLLLFMSAGHETKLFSKTQKSMLTGKRLCCLVPSR
jgi:hypothetical protein